MISLLLLPIAFGADLPGEELFVAPAIQVEQPAAPKKAKIQSSSKIEASALPQEYLRPLARQSTASELVTPPKGSAGVFRALKVGDALELRVLHSVIAFPDEKAPVVAVSESGAFRGLKFIGDSILEKNTQRIFINFNRVVQGDRIFNLKGVGISSQGQPGLTGEYHSREAEYFAGDFVSSFVAGYFDDLVPRHTNVFGQIETDQTVDSAVKKGLASGALSTADRFKEKLKRVPEFLRNSRSI